MSNYVEIATEFAGLLVQDKFEKAYELLSGDAKKELPAAVLKSKFEDMISYGNGIPKVDGFVEKMESWPAKEPADIGWAYVSISGEDFMEAVTVIVTEEKGLFKIRDVEWGRP